MYKKPFGVCAKRYMAQLVLASVCYFYLLRTLIIGVMKRKRKKLVSYGIFYFNKVCSSKILTCVRREAVARFFLLGLVTHYHEP